MSATLAQRWAEFAANAAVEDREAEARARLALLDYLGVALAGSRTEVGRAARAYVTAGAARGGSLVLGTEDRVRAADATLANGIAGHALELDDGHDLAAGHPGVAVMPAVLAYAESDDVAYGDILRAIVLGYEAFIAIGSAINPPHFERGFHTTATVSPFAAAVAAGALAGLDEATHAAALGLAGLSGAGLMQAAHAARGAKPFQVGRGAAAGVTAIEFARAGLAGPPAVLEGPAGFLRAAGGDPDRTAAAAPPSDGRWSIGDTYVKRHPSCRHTHPPIDLALSLRERLDGELGAVDSVTVETYDAAYRLCGVRDPKDPGQAAFSIPFLVAVALERGEIGETQPAPDALADARVRALADRVAVELSDELEAAYPHQRGSRITISLRDGTRIQDRRTGAVGDPDRPLGPAAIADKFSRLVRAVLERGAAARTVEAVLEGDTRITGAELLRPLVQVTKE